MFEISWPAEQTSVFESPEFSFVLPDSDVDTICDAEFDVERIGMTKGVLADVVRTLLIKKIHLCHFKEFGFLLLIYKFSRLLRLTFHLVPFYQYVLNINFN